MYIGCSGFYYPQWKEKFYPGKTPRSEWLRYYSSVFNTVELNGTFYRKPKVADLKRYAQLTPAGFKFSAKASRYITHILRMKGTKEIIREFTQLLEDGLGEKFSHLLFQLPASFKYSKENLDAICENVPGQERSVIEFRDVSWWNLRTTARFRKEGYTFCNTDYPGLRPPLKRTSGSFYLRLHGVPELFKSSYSEKFLRSLVKKIPRRADPVFVYFNNTYFEAAFQNAMLLKEFAAEKS